MNNPTSTLTQPVDEVQPASPVAPVAPAAPGQAAPSTIELRDQIRDAVNAATDAAREASQNARVDVGQDGRPVIILPDGRRIEVGQNRIVLDGHTYSNTPDLRNVVPQGAVDIVQALGATLAICVVGFPLARAVGRWIDRRGNAPRVPSDVMNRLANIENAVDTVAVEVERISEGQRFTTKLLGDRLGNGAGDREGVRRELV